MADALPWRSRDALRAAGIWLVSCALLVLGARAVAAIAPQAGSGGLAGPLLFVVSLGIYAAMPLALYWTIARRHGWQTLTGTSLNSRGLLLVPPFFLVGMLGLVAVNLWVASVGGSSENPQIAALSGGAPLSPLQIGALWLLLAVVVPICEELVFRGVIQPLLMRRLGVPAGVVLGGLVFAVAHLIPMLIPGLFVAGLMLGTLRALTGSIWPGVLYHALQNSLALFAFAAVLNGAV